MEANCLYMYVINSVQINVIHANKILKSICNSYQTYRVPQNIHFLYLNKKKYLIYN